MLPTLHIPALNCVRGFDDLGEHCMALHHLESGIVPYRRAMVAWSVLGTGCSAMQMTWTLLWLPSMDLQHHRQPHPHKVLPSIRTNTKSSVRH